MVDERADNNQSLGGIFFFCGVGMFPVLHPQSWAPQDLRACAPVHCRIQEGSYYISCKNEQQCGGRPVQRSKTCDVGAVATANQEFQLQCQMKRLLLDDNVLWDTAAMMTAPLARITTQVGCSHYAMNFFVW